MAVVNSSLSMALAVGIGGAGVVTCESVPDVNPPVVYENPQFKGTYLADEADQTLLPILEPKEAPIKEAWEDKPSGTPGDDPFKDVDTEPAGEGHEYDMEYDPDTGLPKIVDPGTGDFLDIPGSMVPGQPMNKVDYRDLWNRQVYPPAGTQGFTFSNGDPVFDVDPATGYRTRIAGTTINMPTPDQYDDLYDTYVFFDNLYGHDSQAFKDATNYWFNIFDPNGSMH